MLKVEGAEAREEQEHAKNECVVANTIDDERLLPGIRCRLLPVPESDEKVRTEAHALPSDEHHHETGAENEDEHEGGKQVQVREVPRVLTVGLLMHVGRRVDVDEKSHARDDQDHERRQRVKPEPEVQLQVTRGDPCVQRLGDRPRFRRQAEQPPRERCRDDERRQHRKCRDASGHRLRHAPAHRGIHEKTEQREEGNQREHGVTTSRP